MNSYPEYLEVVPNPAPDDTEEISISFPKAYWKIIQYFLDDLGNRYDNDGCNEFTLAPGKFYEELDKKANPEVYADRENWDNQLEIDFGGEKNEPVSTMNSSILEYFLNEIRKQTNTTGQDESTNIGKLVRKKMVA